MTDIQTVFTRPVTKKPDDLAVPGLPGACPAIEVIGVARDGWFVRYLSLAQYARARSTLAKVEPFSVLLVGSLL